MNRNFWSIGKVVNSGPRMMKGSGAHEGAWPAGRASQSWVSASLARMACLSASLQPPLLPLAQQLQVQQGPPGAALLPYYKQRLISHPISQDKYT